MKTLIAVSLGILAVSAGSGVANAASLNGFNYEVTSSTALNGCVVPEGCKTKVVDATTINFNASGVGAPSTGFAQYTPSGTSQLYTGSQSGVSATPFNDSTRYLSLGSGASTTIKFSGLADYFGLYWGSIDTYNKVEFKKGNTSLAVFGGQQIANLVQSTYSLPTPQFATWNNQYTNVYVDFFSGSADKQFDSVVLSSTGIAFESDNHAYRAAKPVPVPGMLLGVMAAAGTFALKRKQKAAAKA